MSSGKPKRKKEVSADGAGGEPGSDSASDADGANAGRETKTRIDFSDMPPVAGGRGATIRFKQNPPDPPETQKKRRS